MQIFPLNKIGPVVTVLGAAVVLLWSLLAGRSAGTLRARAEFAGRQAGEAQAALRYFYNDFGRYPDAEEFFDQKIMGAYFSAFPLFQPAGQGCDATFKYRLLPPDSYQFGVCSPAAASGLKAGWNIFSPQPK